jgi:hypothetical protein
MTNELTAGNGKPPEPRPIITQVIEFVDGSRIRVIVEAWTGDDDALAKKRATTTPWPKKLISIVWSSP